MVGRFLKYLLKKRYKINFRRAIEGNEKQKTKGRKRTTATGKYLSTPCNAC